MLALPPYMVQFETGRAASISTILQRNIEGATRLLLIRVACLLIREPAEYMNMSTYTIFILT